MTLMDGFAVYFYFNYVTGSAKTLHVCVQILTYVKNFIKSHNSHMIKCTEHCENFIISTEIL